LNEYLVIAPRVSESGETRNNGHITKMGNRIERTALVQSTLIAIGYNPYLKKFYERLKGKKEQGKQQ
jgi:transposase